MLGEDEQEGEGGEAERRQAAAEQEGPAAAADREAHARRSDPYTSSALQSVNQTSYLYHSQGCRCMCVVCVFLQQTQCLNLN